MCIHLGSLYCTNDGKNDMDSSRNNNNKKALQKYIGFLRTFNIEIQKSLKNLNA